MPPIISPSMQLAPAGWRQTFPIALMAFCLHACGAPAESPMRAHELSAAISPSGGAFAAWHGGNGDNSAIYLQKLDAAARPEGAPSRISDTGFAAYEPDLIAVTGGLVVAWYGRDAESGRLGAWLAGVNPTGERQWLVPLQAHGRSKNPVVRRVGDALHAAWFSEGSDGEMHVMHARFAMDGRALSDARQIGLADSNTWNLNASVLGSAFLVTYDAALGDSSDEVRLICVAGDEARTDTLTPPDGYASLYPDLQIGPEGVAALTWFDERDGNQEVYLQILALRDGALAPAGEPRRISHGPADSIGAYIAWNGATLGLAWSDEDAGQRDIFAQTFNARGEPVSAPHNLSTSAENSSVPAIRAYGDGFLVAWNDYLMTEDGGHGSVTSSTARFAILTGNK